MNRAEIREAVKRILSWDMSSNDTVATERLNQCIQSGYNALASECPDALFPDLIRVRTPKTYIGNQGDAVGTKLATTADDWVMEFVGGSFVGEDNGTWNGVYHLQVTLSTGRVVRYGVREVWVTLTGETRLTLDKPWTHGTLLSYNWKLHTPYIYLPENITHVLDAQLYGANGLPLKIEATALGYRSGRWKNVNNATSGTPYYLRREHHKQLVAPNRAPEGQLVDGSWGDEPTGAFEYCFTYILGYRDEYLKSDGGNFIPLLESSPSPISEIFTPTGTDEVELTLPDINWEVNFGFPATQRYGHSGLYRRIYRRRRSVISGSHTEIEYPNVFQFLADQTYTATVFYDDGSIVPDYSIRLPEVHGYYAWSVFPEPMNESEYEFRVMRRPEILMNDQDAPRVAPEMTEALCFYAASYVARYDKDPAGARELEDKAKQITASFRAQYASPAQTVSRQGWDYEAPDYTLTQIARERP